MVFYFSGTGNSYHVARKMAEGLHDRMVDISAAIQNKRFSYTLQEGEKLGFVFPVYSWAMPEAMEIFIRHLKLHHGNNLYTYAVCTCGSSAGKVISFLELALHKKGLELDSGFSVVMPDNYVVLFPLDSPQNQLKKLYHADEVIQLILRAVKLEKRRFFRVKKGHCPNIKSYAVHPLFRIAATKTEPFYSTADCIGCGLCAKVCTSHCISMKEGIPIWTKAHCNMCLACLHHCPQQAIQYGKSTRKQGRYLHPDYKKRKGDTT